MWNYRRIVIAMLATYWLALVIATHYPLEHVPVLFSYQDKAVHVLAYGVFTTLIWWTLQMGPWRGSGWLLAGVLLGMATHAALDEYTQQFFRGRYPDLMDFTADMAGVTMAIPFAEWVFRRITALRIALP